MPPSKTSKTQEPESAHQDQEPSEPSEMKPQSPKPKKSFRAKQSPKPKKSARAKQSPKPKKSARAKQSPKPVKSAKPSGRGSSDAVSIEGSQDPERRKIEHNLRRIMTELPIATPASALCHGFDIADFTQKTLVCELVRKQILKDCSWIASRMMLMMTLMKTNIRSGDADPAQELHQVHLGR